MIQLLIRKAAMKSAEQGLYSWKGNLAAAALSIVVIVAANAWLVWRTDKNWGLFWIWIWYFVPAANMLLMLLGISFRHLVRRRFAVRTLTYVSVVICGCFTAIFVDAWEILVRMPH
jgi:ABC-type multidrug transport system permease subunit